MASFTGAFHILTGIEKMSLGLLNHDNKDRILQSDSLSFCHGFERFAGFKEGERERIANHFTNRFQLDMLDRELSVKVGLTSHRVHIQLYTRGFNIPVGLELGSCQLQRRRHPIRGNELV